MGIHHIVANVAQSGIFSNNNMQHAVVQKHTIHSTKWYKNLKEQLNRIIEE